MVFKRKKIKKQRKRRLLRVRNSLRTENLPRVSVFRSNRRIYAQVISDDTQRTLTSCSSSDTSFDDKADKTAQAFAVGKELAKLALGVGINSVVFDRGRHLYHGRVKALAEGLREGGLKL